MLAAGCLLLAACGDGGKSASTGASATGAAGTKKTTSRAAAPAVIGTHTVGGLVASAGSFTATTVSPATGQYPQSVTTGDFNGDGRLDLATANQESNTMTILLGQGNGRFTTASSPPTSISAVAVTTGDFNDDGKLDLATANGNDSVTILPRPGEGLADRGRRRLRSRSRRGGQARIATPAGKHGSVPSPWPRPHAENASDKVDRHQSADSSTRAV